MIASYIILKKTNKNSDYLYFAKAVSLRIDCLLTKDIATSMCHWCLFSAIYRHIKARLTWYIPW